MATDDIVKIELNPKFCYDYKKVRDGFLDELKAEAQKAGKFTAQGMPDINAVDLVTKEQKALEALQELRAVDAGAHTGILLQYGEAIRNSSTKYYAGMQKIGMDVASYEKANPELVLKAPAHSPALAQTVAVAQPVSVSQPVSSNPVQSTSVPAVASTEPIVSSNAGPQPQTGENTHWPKNFHLYPIKKNDTMDEILSKFRADVSKYDAIKFAMYMDTNGRANNNGFVELEEVEQRLASTELKKLRGEGKLPERPQSTKEIFKEIEEKMREMSKEKNSHGRTEAEEAMIRLNETYPDRTPMDGKWSGKEAAGEWIRFLEEKYGKDFLEKFKQGAGQEEAQDPLKMLKHIKDKADPALVVGKN